MLLELEIRNFALIDKLRLVFSKGLNILTGETGAGKSIIIDSVNFVLGERASKDIIRTGQDKAFVEAVFERINDNPEFDTIMEEYGIEIDDEIIILSRELSMSGRSICRVNGKVVTTFILKSISSFLIDIHGQHEHQSLLDEDNHIKMLDTFGGSELQKIKDKFYEIYKNVSRIKSELKAIMGDDSERQRKLDLLNFQIKEIDEANLKPNEEGELLQQRAILSNANKIFSCISSSYSLLYETDEDNQAIFDKLGIVLSELQAIAMIDEKLGSIYKSIEDSYYLLEGAIDDIREYRDKIEFNPEIIDEIEMRLDLLNKLKRKYGSSIEDILSYREKSYNELQDILNSEEKIKRLKNQLEKESKKLFDLSRDLSDIRKCTAQKLEQDILDELKFLGMEKSKFVIKIDANIKDGQVVYNSNGSDIVSFLISPNFGEVERPLSRIASGGELSRIMLAIKTVMADSDKIPSLIFDEIDTGISGRTAQAVAEKLGQISKNHQVICVTHLPQIASMADSHFYISKHIEGERTKTTVEKLNDEGIIKEIARMLGASKLTDLTLRHAEEMIQIAQKFKENQGI